MGIRRGLFFDQTEFVDLGPIKPFVLFTGVGAITNESPDLLTFVNDLIPYAVGSDSGAVTGFETSRAVMHSRTPLTTEMAVFLPPFILLIEQTAISGQIPNEIPNNSVFTPGCYMIAGAPSTAANTTITLDAQGNSASIFIFRAQGALSFGFNTQVILANKAVAENVFWIVNGAINMGAHCVFAGTLMTKVGAISIGSMFKLSGRITTGAGAIVIDGGTYSLA